MTNPIPRPVGRPKSGRQKYSEIRIFAKTKKQLTKLKPKNQTWDSFLQTLMQILTTRCE